MLKLLQVAQSKLESEHSAALAGRGGRCNSGSSSRESCARGILFTASRPNDGSRQFTRGAARSDTRHLSLVTHALHLFLSRFFEARETMREPLHTLPGPPPKTTRFVGWGREEEEEAPRL